MASTTAQRRNVRATVFALAGLSALFVGMFVRQFVNPAQLDPEWLRARGAVMFETPRAFDAPLGWRSAAVCGALALAFWLVFALWLGVGLGPALRWPGATA